MVILVSFGLFSRGILEHQYYWLILMIVVNVVFTPAAIAAAIYDYARGTTALIPPLIGDPVCAECNKVLKADQMIEHNGLYVCAQCKPIFLQKLAEGVSFDHR
jgi:hypothetical protein